MANVLKYKTSQPTKQALRKGNVVLGTGEENYGPSSTTGYYSGIDVPEDGFVVYTLGLNNNPKVFVAETEDDLPAIARTLGGGVLSVAASKTYLTGLNNTWILDNIPNNVVTNGLVLDLNASNLSSYPESGTTVYDLSGYGNDGTLTNGPTFNSGGWFEIDATDDQILCGNNTELNFTSEMSHEVWFWRDSNATTNLRLTSKGAGGGGTGQQGFSFFGSNTHITWAVNVDGVRTNLGSSITTGKWYHIIGTANLNTGEQKVYLNGVETNSGNLGGSITMASGIQFIIGSYFDPGNLLVWDGKIGPVKLYNRALSESDIKQNYFGGPIVIDGLTFAIDAGNLVSYENGSTTVYPLTGSVSGSLANGPTFNSMNGGVLEFDGTDDKLTFLHNSEFDVSGPFTIDLWFYGGSGIDSYGGLFNKSGNGNFGNWGLYGSSGNDYVRFGYVSSNGGQQECSQASYSDISTPGWYYYCGTYDGSTLRLYRNGAQIASSTPGLSHQIPGVTTTDVGFGYRPGSSAYEVNYKVGAARLYNGKTLTPSEVLQNFNAQKSRFGL